MPAQDDGADALVAPGAFLRNQMRNIAPFVDADRPGRLLLGGEPVLRHAPTTSPTS